MKQQNLIIAISLLAIICAIFTLWRTNSLLESSLRTQSEDNQLLLMETLETLKKLQPTEAMLSQVVPSSSDLSSVHNASNSSTQTENVIANVFDEQITDTEGAVKINQLKANFESLFVTYQYLLKCGLADTTDYYILNSALVHQMSSINAPGRTQYDILTAAKGTYDEIYARSSCDTPDIKTMQQQFKDYLVKSQENRFIM